MFFVPRVKGLAEEAVKAVGFESFVIYRPGLLRCDRHESRPLEAIARTVSDVFDWNDWWSVHVDDLACVVLHKAFDANDQWPVTILEHSEIAKYIRAILYL